MTCTLDSKVKRGEFDPERECLSLEELKEFYKRISKFGKDKRDTEQAASIVGTYFDGQYGNDGMTPIFFMPYGKKRKIISQLIRYSQEKIKEE
jgi:hypothetical protein